MTTQKNKCPCMYCAKQRISDMIVNDEEDYDLQVEPYEYDYE
jgi:hypothetical protein